MRAKFIGLLMVMALAVEDVPQTFKILRWGGPLQPALKRRRIIHLVLSRIIIAVIVDHGKRRHAHALIRAPPE